MQVPGPDLGRRPVRAAAAGATPSAGGRPAVAWRSRLGWAVVIGPWLAKNVVDTGNPVYPLGYRVFGGRHWDAAREAKWSAAHGPQADLAPALWSTSVVDVAGRSDWQSPLYVAPGPAGVPPPGLAAVAPWRWRGMPRTSS